MSDLDRAGWFADPRDEDDEDLVPGYPWTPFLQSPGMCTPLRLGFATKVECEQWIRDNVIGKGMLP